MADRNIVNQREWESARAMHWIRRHDEYAD